MTIAGGLSFLLHKVWSFVYSCTEFRVSWAVTSLFFVSEN